MKKSIKKLTIMATIAAGALAFHPTFAMENFNFQNMENILGALLVDIYRQTNPNASNGRIIILTDSDSLNHLQNAINSHLDLLQNTINNYTTVHAPQTSEDNASTTQASVENNNIIKENDDLINSINNLKIQNQTSNNISTAQPPIKPLNSEKKQDTKQTIQKLSELYNKLIKRSKEIQKFIQFNDLQKKNYPREKQTTEYENEDAKKIKDFIDKVEMQSLINLSADFDNLNIDKVKNDLRNLVIENIKIDSTRCYSTFAEAIKFNFTMGTNVGLQGVIDFSDGLYKKILDKIYKLKNKINKDDLNKFIELKNKIVNDHDTIFRKQAEEINLRCKEESKNSKEQRLKNIDYYLDMTKNMICKVGQFEIDLTNLLFDGGLFEYIEFQN